MKEEIIDWIKTIIVGLLMGLVLITFAQPTIVNGDSMNPTLNSGDVLLGNRFVYKVKDLNRGDIIVFEFEQEEKNFIKRVIGVEGDTVEIKNGIVYVNDLALEEPYLDDIDITSSNLKVEVPKGTVFAVGDNRNNSKDSRYSEVGPVDKSLILGKAYFRLYPFSKIGIVK